MMIGRKHVAAFIAITVFAGVVAEEAVGLPWRTKKKDPVVVEEDPPAADEAAADEAAAESANVSEGSGTPAGMVAKVHRKIANKKTEEAFVKLARGKKTTITDLVVLRRLLAEKKRELEAFNGTLQKEFFLKPEKRYHYDNSAMIIYELPPADADAADAANQRVHARITEKAKADRFVQLAATKKQTLDKIRALQLMIREKQVKYQNYDKLLNENFAVFSDRNYRYNAEEMILYELVAAGQ